MQDIFYDPSKAHDGLDTVAAGYGQIDGLKQDAQEVRRTMESLFTGGTPDAMNAAYGNFENQMDDIIATARQLNERGRAHIDTVHGIDTA
ncbi:hypothetical protein PP588_23075, partial [Mycobacteroides abscessus]|nr:hypothetical protein [Mycobacteroides abscessus]